MATYNIDHEILRDAIAELEEAKKLLQYGINGNCNGRAMQKIDFAIATIKGKIEIEPKSVVSSCCSFVMIPPDWEMAERMGSLWRAYACYICKKCGKMCEAKEQ